MRVSEAVDSSTTTSLGVLAGCRVAVTRAVHQAEALTEGIENLGGQVILFPTLAIEKVLDANVEAKLTALPQAHLVIFVSPNAVWHGLALVRARSLWPKLATIAAVGCSTANLLEEQQLTVSLKPKSGSGSAALLELPAFSAEELAGRRVSIFKGRGGLPMLAEVLTARGAVVDELEVYERRVPDADARPFVAEAEGGRIDVVIITSGQAIENLFEMVGPDGRRWLCDADLVVVSERIANVALSLGAVRRPRVAKGATLENILDELKRWKESKHDGQERRH